MTKGVNMLLARMKEGKVVQIIPPGKSIKIDGISHPSNIRDIWSDEELGKLRLKRVSRERAPAYNDITHKAVLSPVRIGQSSTAESWEIVTLDVGEKTRIIEHKRDEEYRRKLGASDKLSMDILNALDKVREYPAVSIGPEMVKILEIKSSIDDSLPMP